MSISAVDAVTPAIDRAKHICFNPFDFGKWFLLGFSAWLAMLAEGGVLYGQLNLPTQFGPEVKIFIKKADENLPLVMVCAAFGALFYFFVMQVLNWVKCRGLFMFMDNIAHNRELVTQPWHEFAREGNSLFLLFLGLHMAMFAVHGGVLVLALYLSWGDLVAFSFTNQSLIAIVLYLLILLPALLIFGISTTFVRDFIAPTMYLRRIKAPEAWQVVRREILPNNLGAIAVYFCLKIAYSMLVGTVFFVVFCLTCCIAGLPYIGAVALLPLHVFERSMVLFFLGQLGPAWTFFKDDPVPATAIAGSPEPPPAA